MRLAVVVGLLAGGVASGRDGSTYAPPPPARLAFQSDSVVVGTVTAIEPEPRDVWFPAVHFYFSPAGPQPARVVRVRVEEKLLGRCVPAEVRVALQRPPAVGERRAFLLNLPQAGGLRPLVPHVWDAVPLDDPAGRQLRYACKVLNDPLGGLTAPARIDRYRAALILLDRWGSMWGSLTVGRRTQPVPDELVRLALRSVADLPAWSNLPDDVLPPTVLLWSLRLSSDWARQHDTGLGWTWPDPAWPPFDDSWVGEAMAEWVATAESWGWDARRLMPAVRRVYNVANRPQPPAPVPTDGQAELARVAVQHLFGWEPDLWAGWTKSAFELWLDGAGRRFAPRTATDGLRPTATGGWDR